MITIPNRGLVTWPRLNRRWCFFPSLLSSELLLFFTAPKLNASFKRRPLRKSQEWARYNSNDLLMISEWPLQMSLTLFSLTRSLLTPICFSRVPLIVVQQPTSNHSLSIWLWIQDELPVRSDLIWPGSPIRSTIWSDPSNPIWVLFITASRNQIWNF